jgi:hypothetical protein
VVYTVTINKAVRTKSQCYNCFIANGENAIPKRACLEAKGSNPTAGPTLLWARTALWEHSNHRQVTREQLGQIVLGMADKFSVSKI